MPACAWHRYGLADRECEGITAQCMGDMSLEGPTFMPARVWRCCVLVDRAWRSPRSRAAAFSFSTELHSSKSSCSACVKYPMIKERCRQSVRQYRRSRGKILETLALLCSAISI